MATASGQGHHFGQITAEGNSHLTLGNVYIHNVARSGNDVSSDTAKQTGTFCVYRSS